MEKEVQALIHNNMWTLVDPPANMNIVSCRWVYKIKRKVDGSIKMKKEQLVVQGFSQVDGVDFDETYNSIITFPTIPIMITLAISQEWNLHQLDVDNTFLNGDLKESAFMG